MYSANHRQIEIEALRERLQTGEIPTHEAGVFIVENSLQLDVVAVVVGVARSAQFLEAIIFRFFIVVWKRAEHFE